MRIKGGPYATIDEEVARQIKRLHKRHPNLGHEGLTSALEQDGIHVDEHELKRFVGFYKLAPGVTARPSLAWVARRWVLPGRFFGGGDSGDGGDSD
jgi:hypothetical protein